MSLRALALSSCLFAAACALEDVWTGSACTPGSACTEPDATGDVTSGDSGERGDAAIVTPLGPGCPTGRFAIDVSAAYRASPSGVCFLVGPTDTLQTDGTWYMALKSSPRDAGSADIEGCLRVPGQGEDAGAADIDWRASLSGHMDCTTGAFTAEIRATYNVVSVCTLGVLPTRYYAKGPLTGVYDRATDRFVDGDMTMTEPPVILGEPPGGVGTWSGGRAEGPYDSNLNPMHCLGGVTFPNEMFARDAGTRDAAVP